MLQKWAAAGKKNLRLAEPAGNIFFGLFLRRIGENLFSGAELDDFALKELLTTTSLGQHIIQQLSPRLVVIAADSVAPLMAEMIRKGYTPKMEEAPS